MILFWVFAALMIAAGLAIVLPALWSRDAAPAGVQRDALNVQVYKDQLAELDTDLRIGTVSAEHFAQSKLDLEHELLGDVGDVSAAAPVMKTSAAGRYAAVVVAVAVPLLALGMYMIVGKGHSRFEQQGAPMAQAPAAAGPEISPQVMVAQLAERLKANPNDGNGWVMLGRSYGVLGRYKEAGEAYAKALELMGEYPDLLADYAEVEALSKPNSDLSGTPTELFTRALVLDHDNPKALWLSGMAAFQKQDYAKAAATWKRLLTLMPGDTEGLQTVQQHIAEAEARAAKMGKTPDNTVKAKK